VQEPQVKVAFGQKQLASYLGLGFARGREINVLPPGEEVEVVPLRATVAEQYEVRHPLSVVLARFSLHGAPASPYQD
jgi:hypothetical protein